MLTQIPTNPLNNNSKVNMGKPLDLSNAELDEMAKVTPADIAYAAEQWRSLVPAKYVLLLNSIGILKGSGAIR